MVSAFLLFVAFWSLSHGCSSFIKGLLTRPLAQSRTMEAKLEKTQTCMGKWRRAGRGANLVPLHPGSCLPLSPWRDVLLAPLPTMRPQPGSMPGPTTPPGTPQPQCQARVTLAPRYTGSSTLSPGVGLAGGDPAFFGGLWGTLR